MENSFAKPTASKRSSSGRQAKKTGPAPLPPEASARVSAAAAAAGAVKPAPAPKPAAPVAAAPAKPAAPAMARPVPPAPKITLPTVAPVAARKVARKVEMSFDAPFAKFVNIAGDFNAWEMTTLAMRKSDGVWKITLELKPGTYQYKFLADGEWVNDPNNVRTAPNQFGSLNNVLEVS